ncbi:MAG: hypothetical protein E5W21_11940 [Mesorhizobium sp.]|nr:MAG: hypothetical protein E5W21_11940 [Mesorhizobium sp.]
MNTSTRVTVRHPILDLFVAPFRSRSRRLLDQRALSDHFKRDIGLLDGHAPYGSIREARLAEGDRREQ